MSKIVVKDFKGKIRGDITIVASGKVNLFKLPIGKTIKDIDLYIEAKRFEIEDTTK